MVRSEERIPCIGGGAAAPEPLGGRRADAPPPGGKRSWGGTASLPWARVAGEGLLRGREATPAAPPPPAMRPPAPPPLPAGEGDMRFWTAAASAEVGRELRYIQQGVLAL